MERFLLNLWVVGGTAVGGTAVGGTVMDTSDAMLSVAIDVTYLKHISKSLFDITLVWIHFSLVEQDIWVKCFGLYKTNVQVIPDSFPCIKETRERETGGGKRQR